MDGQTRSQLPSRCGVLIHPAHNPANPNMAAVVNSASLAAILIASLIFNFPERQVHVTPHPESNCPKLVDHSNAPSALRSHFRSFYIPLSIPTLDALHMVAYHLLYVFSCAPPPPVFPRVCASASIVWIADATGDISSGRFTCFDDPIAPRAHHQSHWDTRRHSRLCRVRLARDQKPPHGFLVPFCFAFSVRLEYVCC
jgi:hypothetical protein